MIGGKMMQAASVADYIATVMDDNPTVFYMFQESEGDVIDLTNTGWDLSADGIIVREKDRVVYNYLSVFFGGAGYFRNDTMSRGLTGTEVTMETWVTPISDSCNHYFIAHETYNTLLYGIEMKCQGGTVYSSINNGGVQLKRTQSPTTLKEGQVYHIVGRFGVDWMDLWINGKLVDGPEAHDKGISWVGHPTDGIYCGALPASLDTWFPYADSYQTGLALYEYALPPHRISAHHSAGKQGF
jgi:hypothetical protein